ncbi:MAG: hypothetical protein K2G36_11050 [Ruminococcus sp.]|nr:hypothetical protein [Ruminococcus sp.]
MIKNMLKKVRKFMTTAVITGTALVSATGISASAADVWQADYMGNYVRDVPYGYLMGSIAGGTQFDVMSTTTAYDGTLWGYTGNGYVCLDYCTPLQYDYNYDYNYSYDYYNSYAFNNYNQQYIYQHFINMGMPSESAIAIASNLFDESGCSPNAYFIDVNNLPSYGICQWNGIRYDNLRNWCWNNGYDYTTLDGQLAYLDHELYGTFYYVYSQLMNGDSVWDMAYIWASQFEICSDAFWNTRGNNAVYLYNNVMYW